MLQGKRYGLAVTAAAGVMRPVEAEVKAFKVWRVCAINLNRTRPVECIEAETFDDQDAPRIMCYLGFVYKYRVDCTGQPSLLWYTQLPWILDFVQFLVSERQAGQARPSSLHCTNVPMSQCPYVLMAHPNYKRRFIPMFQPACPAGVRA